MNLINNIDLISINLKKNLNDFIFSTGYFEYALENFVLYAFTNSSPFPLA